MLVGLALILASFVAALGCAWLGLRAEVRAHAVMRETMAARLSALEGKYLAADLNGWQTAYAFDVLRGVPGATEDAGRSRARYLDAVRAFELELRRLQGLELEPDERLVLGETEARFREFQAVDDLVVAAYRDGRPEQVAWANDLVLNREIALFQAMLEGANTLADRVAARAAAAAAEADGEVAWATLGLGLAGGAATLSMLVSLVWIGRLLRRQAQLLRRLDELARTDPLTGIANRRVWEEEVPRELGRARRTRAPVVVVLFDLDHFKRYNDSRGHVAGDLLLRALAALVRENLRQGDLVARYGGEEFGLLLPGCDAAGAVALMERLRGTLPDGQTFSAGVAVWDFVEDRNSLVARADAALYRAKAEGRDRTCVAVGGAAAPPPTGVLPALSLPAQVRPA